MSLHTSAPHPPSSTAQPQQPGFSTGSLFILILQHTALPLSFFSLPLPPTTPPLSKVLINSQYSWEVWETPTLLPHTPTATLNRATGCPAQSLSRLRSAESLIHGLYFRCGGQVHEGGSELLFCSSMSPFVLLFSLCPSSSSRTKSVCDTISTPGIIAAATNAAERGKKGGGVWWSDELSIYRWG